MIEEYEKKRKKHVALMKSLLDYGMGLILLLAGLFFAFRGKFQISFNERFPPDSLDMIFGIICIIYGSWRIYRGYQKKYFK